MKRFSLVAMGLIVVAAISALASPNPSTAKGPVFPGILANARYVYVASYDGDQFDPSLLPEDRDAIGAVQNAIQNWGKLTIVYRPAFPGFGDRARVAMRPAFWPAFSGVKWDSFVAQAIPWPLDSRERRARMDR